MAEEQEESTGKSFKGILITLVSTVTLGIGGWITTKLTGGDKEEEKPAAQPSIIINNSQQQQQAAGGTKTVVIKEKATPAEPKPAPKPKKEADEFKEKPAQW